MAEVLRGSGLYNASIVGRAVMFPILPGAALRFAPSRCLNPLACWWVGEPAVCNLKGSVAVSARHADFWYLIGGLAHTHNGPYFPKYIILIAMMFVFISALQGCAPGFQIHWHSPSLLCEDYCYATVCAIRRPRGLQEHPLAGGPGPIGAGLCLPSV